MKIAEEIFWIFIDYWPFLLLLGWPWLCVVWLAAIITRDILPPRTRFVLLSGIAAAGLAPAFGGHFLFPMYMELYYAVGACHHIENLASFALTWGFFLLVGFGVAWYRARRNQARLKKEPEGLS